jgi:hypothetical protein
MAQDIPHVVKFQTVPVDQFILFNNALSKHGLQDAKCNHDIVND